MGSCKLILNDYRILLLIACFFYLGSPEDDDKHFLERLGVSSDASNMASMVSWSSVKICFQLEIIFRRSIFFFVISIMAFVWRTGTIEDASQTPIISHDALAPRIIVTCLFSLGLVYLIFIRITFQKYGSSMDRAWRSRVLAWMHRNLDDIPIEPRHSLQESFPSGFKSSKHAPLTTGTSPHASQNASRPTTPVLEERPRGRSTSIKPISTFVKADRQSPAASRKSVIKLTKILGLSADDPSADVIPSKETLMSYKMTKDDWEQLFSVRF